MAIKRGTAHRDVIFGTNAADTLYGNGGNDDIYGLGGNDKLYGGAGNDVLYGGKGGDKLYGGTGFDKASYAKASGHINVDLATTGNLGGGEAARDRYSSIEGIVGSKYGDFLSGSGRGDYLEGGRGGDVIRGGNGSDKLFGGSGADYFDMYGTGADKVDGGSGIDAAYYNGATSSVQLLLSAAGSGRGYGGAAGDTFKFVESIWGSDYGDMLRAGKGGTVYGNPGNDLIYDAYGTATHEVLAGGDGADVLDGTMGAGNDYFVVDTPFYDGGSTDTIRGFDPWVQQDRLATFGWAPTSSQVINSTTNAATIAGQQFIFETDTDVLWFDYDGTGFSYAPVAVAYFDPATTTASTIEAWQFVRIDMW